MVDKFKRVIFSPVFDSGKNAASQLVLSLSYIAAIALVFNKPSLFMPLLAFQVYYAVTRTYLFFTYVNGQYRIATTGDQTPNTRISTMISYLLPVWEYRGLKSLF